MSTVCSMKRARSARVAWPGPGRVSVAEEGRDACRRADRARQLDAVREHRDVLAVHIGEVAVVDHRRRVRVGGGEFHRSGRARQDGTDVDAVAPAAELLRAV